MILKDLDNANIPPYPVQPGDNLYFMRDQKETTLRVKASVIGVCYSSTDSTDDLSPVLKEMQSRLQLTEEQFHFWSTKKRIQLVEFSSAHKIEGIQLSTQGLIDQCGWIAFDDFRINV